MTRAVTCVLLLTPLASETPAKIVEFGLERRLEEYEAQVAAGGCGQDTEQKARECVWDYSRPPRVELSAKRIRVEFAEELSS